MNFPQSILQAKNLFVVTRKRSYIGLPKKYKDACYALGLKKLQHTNLLCPTKDVVGNLAMLRNLITIRYVEGGPFSYNTLLSWLNGRNKPAEDGFFVEKQI